MSKPQCRRMALDPAETQAPVSPLGSEMRDNRISVIHSRLSRRSAYLYPPSPLFHLSRHESSQVKCPKCSSLNIRKSKRGNARLVFPLSLFVTSLRCHNCGKRYLRFGVLPGREFLATDELATAKSA